MDSENNSKTLLTNINVTIVSLLLLVVVMILSVVLITKNKNKATNDDKLLVGTDNTQNDAPQTSNSSALAPGQTNPNIVGFGQTFECNPRSDEEFYRTDKTFVIDPQNPQTMYISAEYLGFHKSVDGGKTWTRLENGITTYASNEDPNKPCYPEYPFALVDPTNSDRIILLKSGAGGTPKDVNALSSGIAESLDGGQTFKQMIRDDMNGYVSSVTFDPTDPSILYYGTNSSPASYNEADPNKIFVETGLVYKYENGSWSELPTGFNLYTGATGVHVNPENPNEIVVFTMSAPKPQGGQRSVENAEQMGVLRSNDGGKTWNATHPLPSGYEPVILHDVAKNFRNMFVTPFTQGGVPAKSFYSTDGGLTFNESAKYMDFVAYDPNDASGNRLLGFVWQSMSGPALNKLYESTDAGATWHEFVNLPTEITNVGDKKTFISNIVWDPVDANTFYMSGASALLWKTTNNGQSFEKLLDYTMLKK